MSGKIYLYILVCAAVSFLIRELPLTLIRKPIKSRFLRSFLFYVPYVTLAVMTFPSIVHATNSPIAGLAALVLGIAAAWFGAFSSTPYSVIPYYNRRTPRPDGRGLRKAEHEVNRRHEVGREHIKLNADPQHQCHTKQPAERNTCVLFCQQQAGCGQIGQTVDNQQCPAGER